MMSSIMKQHVDLNIITRYSKEDRPSDSIFLDIALILTYIIISTNAVEALT